MRPIPVGATVRDAYVFTATHLGGIIGVIWVPMVLITVAQFFTFYRCFNDFIDAMASGNTAPAAPALLMMLGYLVAALLLQAMMCVGVVQLALGARTAPALVHYSPSGHRNGGCSAPFAFCVSAYAGLVLVILAGIAETPALQPARSWPSDDAGAGMPASCWQDGAFLALLPAIAAGENATGAAAGLGAVGG